MQTLLPNENIELKFKVVDLWEDNIKDAQIGIFQMSDSLELIVDPSGGSRMVLLTKV